MTGNEAPRASGKWGPPLVTAAVAAVVSVGVAVGAFFGTAYVQEHVLHVTIQQQCTLYESSIVAYIEDGMTDQAIEALAVGAGGNGSDVTIVGPLPTDKPAPGGSVPKSGLSYSPCEFDSPDDVRALVAGIRRNLGVIAPPPTR